MAKKTLPEEALEFFRKAGAKGGKKGGAARAANLTPEQLSEIGRKGVAAREAKRAAGKTTPVKKAAAKKAVKSGVRDKKAPTDRIMKNAKY